MSHLKLFRYASFSRLIPLLFIVCSIHVMGVFAESLSDQKVAERASDERYQGQSIISLAPHITELLFELGVGERIVGTVSYSDYPEAARSIRRIGDASNFDLEAIVGMAPDLVIAWQSGTPKNAIEQLAMLGINVHLVESKGMSSIARNIRELGVLVGKQGVAESRVAEFKERIDVLEKRYRDKPKLKVFYQIWHQPLMTINGDHAIDDVIELCGGINPFSQSTNLAPQIDLEAVILADPDVILISSGAVGNADMSVKWRKWHDIKAVKQNQIYSIPWDLISRQSMRILEGAEYVCEAIQKARN